MSDAAMPTLPGRRTSLGLALAAAGLLALGPQRALAADALAVGNVTGLYSVQVARIVSPMATEDVANAVRAWPGKVAVGGARFSMGGQVAIRGGLHLNMRSMNRIVWIRPELKRVRVQAGMHWRELQDLLDPANLAVKTMQSYANFSIGGSVSVNAHGRYVEHGPVGNTVLALQLVLADGGVVEATRTQHSDLFRAAVGGYGGVGVITEIELEVADNVRIEREVVEVPLAGYVAHFDANVSLDSASVLHNADLLPPLFNRPACITWRKSAKPLTESARLVPRGENYAAQRLALWAVTELPGGSKLRRSVIHPLMSAGPSVKWLNREASLDVAELAPFSRSTSTYALQEYFVPRRHFLLFARGMAAILRRNHVEAVNVSIRHSPADTLAVLPWAKEEVFAFVLFFKQGMSAASRDAVGRWTRELIALAIDNDGRYYLPYQLHATAAQFAAAYPEAGEFRRIKRSVDPGRKFSNELWSKYL